MPLRSYAMKNKIAIRKLKQCQNLQSIKTNCKPIFPVQNQDFNWRVNVQTLDRVSEL